MNDQDLARLAQLRIEFGKKADGSYGGAVFEGDHEAEVLERIERTCDKARQRKDLGWRDRAVLLDVLKFVRETRDGTYRYQPRVVTPRPLARCRAPRRPSGARRVVRALARAGPDEPDPPEPEPPSRSCPARGAS